MKTVNEKQSVDFWLLLTALVLAGTGLVMVYSSSMYLSMDRIGDGMFYFKKQAMRLLIGLCVMMVLTKINYRGYAKLGLPLLVFGFMVLIALLVQKQVSGKGVERWLRLGFVSFQPSEMMKVIVVVFLSSVITRMGDG